MALIVKKFGGTSVGSTEKIINVAKRIIEEKKPGDQIVMVVSAMGDTTDKLIELAKGINKNPYQYTREMDMLLTTGEQVSISLLTMAFKTLGQKAISLTGSMVGMKTDSVHTKGKILDIKPSRVKEELEMARLGAGVMQPRSVEMGKYFNIPIHVRSTFTNKPGTMIREAYTMEEKDFLIRGVAHDDNVAKIAILGVPNNPGIAHNIFSALADKAIGVDMIVQSIRNIEKNVTDMVFTIASDDLSQAKPIIDEVADKLNAIAVLIEEDVAKVSIVGAGMLGNPGIAARMFGALAKANVNMDAISTSEISISCLIKGDQLKVAANAIHKEFFPEN